MSVGEVKDHGCISNYHVGSFHDRPFPWFKQSKDLVAQQVR